MKKCLILFLAMYGTMFAQGADHILMINTEYAFAESAIHDGVRQSFLNFIADDGILFRPHPLNGKEFLEKSKPGSGYLFWYPSRSAISAAGDMGYTTGPWSFRKEKDSPEIGFGEFCTVWEKKNDGSFRFDIDYGISHEKPIEIQAPIHFEKTLALEKQNEQNEFPKVDLSEIEKKLSGDARKVYSNESRFMIDGSYPYDGVNKIVKFFDRDLIKEIKYTSLGWKISRSNDLGFTYGSLIVGRNPGNEKTIYYYSRIWQLNKREWKVIAEVWNEKPKENTN